MSEKMSIKYRKKKKGEEEEKALKQMRGKVNVRFEEFLLPKSKIVFLENLRCSASSSGEATAAAAAPFKNEKEKEKSV